MRCVLRPKTRIIELNSILQPEFAPVKSAPSSAPELKRFAGLDERMAAKDPSPTPYITLDAAGCVAAGIVAIGFLVFIGPGLE
jgi:hypothetical protein